MKNLLRNFCESLVFLSLILTTLLGLGSMTQAQAAFKFKDLVYGVSPGFGNQNLDKEVTYEGDVYNLSRGESPLMLGLSVEGFLTNRWSLAVSHRRGFRLGPFSSGLGFSGIIARYYFLRPAPIIPPKELSSSVVVRSWSPFVGFGTGVAHGSTKREGELVETTSSSGMFVGGHIGLDYQWTPSLVLRPELMFNTTIISDATVPATLTEMALLIGLHFRI